MEKIKVRNIDLLEKFDLKNAIQYIDLNRLLWLTYFSIKSNKIKMYISETVSTNVIHLKNKNK